MPRNVWHHAGQLFECQVRRRTEEQVCHFWTVTRWDNFESIKKFAGDEYEKARYYPDDSCYLLELEPTVLHSEAFVFEPKRELVIQRDISGGAQHVYRVSLEKGQCIRFNVEQMGIELVVLVLDPNNRKIGEFASENAAACGIIVQFVAELPGMYSLGNKNRETRPSSIG